MVYTVKMPESGLDPVSSSLASPRTIDQNLAPADFWRRFAILLSFAVVADNTIMLRVLAIQRRM
jgi:hypothetical protein